MIRPNYRAAIESLGVLRSLAEFQPHIAGTPPLGLETDASDIDILCQATDFSSFVIHVWSLYADKEAFRLWQWASDGRPLIASFSAHGWVFEIFASNHPVEMQTGWRHYDVERRLLSLGGVPLKNRVLELRSAGMKTEPAFWSALNCSGDSYSGMLKLYHFSDCALAQVLEAAGFIVTAQGLARLILENVVDRGKDR